MVTQTAPFHFKQTSVVGGSSTLEFDMEVELNKLAWLGGNSNWTAVALTPTASQVVAAAQRNSITLTNPPDGAPINIGFSSALVATSGALLPPGTKMKILGYNGAIWALCPNGATASLFYKTT